MQWWKKQESPCFSCGECQFLLCTDEFVKWPWVLKRYKSGLWAKNITRDHLFEDEEKE